MDVAALTTEPRLLALAAELHARELPGSLLTLAGCACLRGAYAYAARSGHEAVFVAHDPTGALIGAALLSLAPGTLSRRLLWHTRLAVSLLVRPRLTTRLVIGEVRSTLAPGGNPDGGDPEVVAIFVNRHRRGSGTGRALLGAVERHLACISVTSYIIRTEDRSDNRAIPFYRSMGFSDAAEVMSRGTAFRLMRKQIEANEKGLAPELRRG